jgi:hypothetical protein
MGLKDFIGGLFEPARELVSELITDKDKANELRAKLFEIQTQAANKVIDYEQELVKAQSAVIVAEASSEGWMARNWRPITMLTFVVLIVAQWFGLTDEHITNNEAMALFDIIKIALGGYVIGRSVEKIAPQVVDVMTMNKKANKEE